MESFLCARDFFSVFSLSLFRSAPLPPSRSLLVRAKRATRVLRFCGRQPRWRGRVEAELRPARFLVVHPLRRRCESAKSWHLPPPTTHTVPSCKQASMFYALCYNSVSVSVSVAIVAVASSGFGFRFVFSFSRMCGLSLAWTETGIGLDRLSLVLESGLGDRLCGPGVARAATVAIEVYLWPTAFG